MSRPNSDWFRYAVTSDNLMVATARVYADFDEAGSKPAAEKWVINTAYFNLLKTAVVAAWCKITGLDSFRFPFTDDFVRWAWLTYRKDGGPEGELYKWAQGQKPSLFV